MIMGIGTGSAYNAAKFCGNSRGVPGIGEAEVEFKVEITRLLGPLARLVAFVAGLGLGLGFRLRFRVDEDSVATVNPHLGMKHDIILTADASGRSKSRTLLLAASSPSVGGGSRIPGTNDVERDGGGVIGRLWPALAGSELESPPIRLRKNNLLASPLPIPKFGGVRLLKTDPKRPLYLSLTAPWAGFIPGLNAASELERRRWGRDPFENECRRDGMWWGGV